MLKLILCLVFIVTTTLYGFIISQKLTTRKKTLESVVDSIIRMKSLITFGSFEISRIIQDSFGSIKGFEAFRDCYSDSENLFLYWQKTVYSLPNELCLNANDKELLIKFSRGLGVTDVEGQISNCDLYCELFKEAFENAKEKEKTSGRLYKILGFSLGCVITLMIV